MKRYLLCKSCLFVIGILFAVECMGVLPEKSYKSFSGRTVIATGTVDSVAEKKKDNQKKQTVCSLKNVAFCDEDSPDKTEYGYKAKGILCCLKEGQPIPGPGEKIKVCGIAQDFWKGRNPGGPDMESYYRGLGLCFQIKDGVILDRNKNYNLYKYKLYKLRTYMEGVLDEICPEEDRGIVKALLLGDKAELSEGTKDLYQKGGISHILAISGLHITFLGAGFYKLCKRTGVSIKAGVFVSGAFLASYVVMTGASASAVRASAMFLTGLLAEATGRAYERLTALSVAALGTLLFFPHLVLQSSFLLSYGAILGLHFVLPVFEDMWSRKIYKLFGAGISVFLVTLPVILSSFYEFPVYSFLLNLFVIPLMSIVMGTGIGALLTGMVSTKAGILLFLPVHWILRLFGLSCLFAEKLPGSVWRPGKPEPVQIFLYYSFLAVLILWKKYNAKAYMFLVLCAMFAVLSHPVRPEFTITQLYVGQGDGIVLQKEGKICMIDGGSSTEKNLWEYTLLPYFKSQGICRIDTVIITHMDEDHYNGIEEMIAYGKEEHLSITNLILPALKNPDDAYRRLCLAAQKKKIRVYTIGAGDTFTLEGIEICCLHPEKNRIYEDKNQASLVLLLKWGRWKALFTGDLDGRAEEEFARSSKELCDVSLLKAGHHGSAASCGETLLKIVKPEIALISCGEKNRYGHPAGETLTRLEAAGAQVFRTDEHGAVILRIEKNRILTLPFF